MNQKERKVVNFFVGFADEDAHMQPEERIQLARKERIKGFNNVIGNLDLIG